MCYIVIEMIIDNKIKEEKTMNKNLINFDLDDFDVKIMRNMDKTFNKQRTHISEYKPNIDPIVRPQEILIGSSI